MYRQLGTACLVWGFLLVALVPGLAVAGSFHFSDDFEDGDISDWTTVSAGTGVVETSTNRPLGGRVWSLHIESIEEDDQAYALGPAGQFADLDYAEAYTIDFDFNYDKSNDPNGFHFLEVMAMNGPGGVARQVGLYLDTPGGAGGQDALIYRDDVPSNHSIAGLKEDVWYHLAMDVDPAPETYDLTLTSPQGTQEVYDLANGWVNQVVTTDIPFIGAGQSDGFFPFRLGDRNADAVTYDHGEAYWDNIVVDGTRIPEPATLSLLALGGLGALIRRRRRQTRAQA